MSWDRAAVEGGANHIPDALYSMSCGLGLKMELLNYNCGSLGSEIGLFTLPNNLNLRRPSSRPLGDW